MLLDTVLDNQTWIFLQSFYKLVKKDKIKILKKGDTYRLDIIDPDKSTQSEMENIRNVVNFMDNLYNSDLSVFNNILETDEEDNEKFVIFLRDIKKSDINIIFNLYNIITKKEHLLDANSFKQKFYEFIKNIYKVDLSIKDVINKYISFKPITELTLKEKQSLRIILITTIIFANYYQSNKKNEFKYISRIDNFFTDKYEKFLYIDIDKTTYINYLIKFIVSLINNLKNNKDIAKSWIFSVLLKVELINRVEYSKQKKEMKEKSLSPKSHNNTAEDILKELKNI